MNSAEVELFFKLAAQNFQKDKRNLCGMIAYALQITLLAFLEILFETVDLGLWRCTTNFLYVNKEGF